MRTTLPLLVHTVLSQIRTCTLIGFSLHSTLLLFLLHVATLMKPCKCYVMLEPRTHLLHNVSSEASGVFRAVSPCGLLSSVSSSGVHFGHCFVWVQPMQTPLFPVGGIGWQWTGPTLRLSLQHICIKRRSKDEISTLLDSLFGTQFSQTIPPLQSDPGTLRRHLR